MRHPRPYRVRHRWRCQALRRESWWRGHVSTTSLPQRARGPSGLTSLCVIWFFANLICDMFVWRHWFMVYLDSWIQLFARLWLYLEIHSLLLFDLCLIIVQSLCNLESWKFVWYIRLLSNLSSRATWAGSSWKMSQAEPSFLSEASLISLPSHTIAPGAAAAAAGA